MPDFSFTVYCCNARADNLAQTLRFLARREGEIAARSEVVVVCQDHLGSIKLPGEWHSLRVVNLSLSHFNKPRMVNEGVRQASAGKVVLLDGDRILPPGFFSRELERLRPGRVVTTERLYRLAKSYADEEIEAGNVNRFEDFRVPEVLPGRKNAFSGMALFCKEDYDRVGGMDESFVNYGCSDTDFTRACISAGLEIEYLPEEELHLWHSVAMSHSTFFLLNLKSVCRYCLKWGDTVPQMFKEKLRSSILE